MKIALLGPFGHGNLGDAAIQQSMISELRARLPDAELVGISLNPEDTMRRHGLPSYPLSWLPSDVPKSVEHFVENLSRAANGTRWERMARLVGRVSRRLPVEWRFWVRTIRAMREIDVLIFSGGGQIDDYWGGPWSHPFNFLRWTFVARLQGCKVLVVSVGAGPLDSRLSRFFTRLYLSMAQYRSYRDPASKEFLLRLGFAVSQDPVFPDLAHGIAVRTAKSLPHPDDAALRIGIGPIVYFHPDVWPEGDWAVYRTYIGKMAAIAEGIRSRGHRVVFIPGEARYDRLAIDDVLKTLRVSANGEEGVRAAPVASVDELLAEIRSCDAVITSRFHGVILSHTLSRPVLAIAHHQKITILMDAVGHTAFCLDINGFTPEAVLEKLDLLLHDRVRLAKEIDETEDACRSELDLQYETITRIIRGTAPGRSNGAGRTGDEV